MISVFLINYEYLIHIFQYAKKEICFMIIRLKIIRALCLFLFLPLFGLNTVTIKVYHVFESFGTETQELKYSTIINYNKKGLISDSTIYSHDIPLSKKYVYITGEKEGLQLQRTYDKEVILSYRFEYDNLKRKTSTSLFDSNDSIYWKEYYKYDDNNYLYKLIRFDPNKAINPEMIEDVENGEMVWAEKYVYFEDGSGFEHRELYNNYCLTITSYDFDSLKTPIKRKEYFDPSVIFQTIYFHDANGNLTHETNSGYLGASLGSKTYEYDSYNRKTKETVYNEKGELEKTYNTVIDDENHVFYDYYSDSLVNFLAIKETRLDNKGRIFIEAILDGQDRLLEKNVFYYDQNERIVEVKKYDMIRKNVSEDYKIPVQVHTYEYD